MAPSPALHVQCGQQRLRINVPASLRGGLRRPVRRLLHVARCFRHGAEAQVAVDVAGELPHKVAVHCLSSLEVSCKLKIDTGFDALAGAQQPRVAE